MEPRFGLVTEQAIRRGDFDTAWKIERAIHRFIAKLERGRQALPLDGDTKAFISYSHAVA